MGTSIFILPIRKLTALHPATTTTTTTPKKQNQTEYYQIIFLKDHLGQCTLNLMGIASGPAEESNQWNPPRP